MTHNTIILRHGHGEINNKGDIIFDNDTEEVMRWTINQEAEARAELARHRCTYREVNAFVGKVIEADEWALEFCACDNDGEFVNGSDFELANE